MSMRASELFRLFAWMVCGIYATIPAFWMLVHPLAAWWRRHGQLRAIAVIGPVWIALWCAAWWLSSPLRNVLLYDRPWMWLLALPFWCVSLYMYSSGARSLSLKRITGAQELDRQPRPDALITTGIHAHLRHPVYLGHLCTMLGWTLGSGSLACLALLAFAVATGAVMVPLEERELRARFGTAWDDYARRVPAIFPRF